MKKLPEIVKIESLEQFMKTDMTGLFAMSNELYHAAPGLSSSSLKKILRSPAHYKYGEHKSSLAMAFGTMVHEAILEPELFQEKYAIMPKIDKRTKAGKAEYALWCTNMQSMIPIDQKQNDIINGITEQFNENKYCKRLTKNSTNELAAFTHDPETDLLLKAKADILHHSKIYAIADIKTCEDARSAAASKAVFNYRYDLSAAFYMDIFSEVLDKKVSSFVWAFIEKTSPYGIKTYMLNDGVYERGCELYRRALTTYKECLDKDEWPCYAENLDDVSLPVWDKE